MRMVLVALVCALRAGVCGAETRPVGVVLLAGQSNMEGAADFEQLSEEDLARIEAVQGRVVVSDMGQPAGRLEPRHSAWWLKKLGYGSVFGLEMFIGVTLAERFPDREFLLIKYAVGGTSLYGGWNPAWSEEKSIESGDHTQTRKHRLFSKHVAVIQEQLEALEQQGRDYEILGLCWMQGENDAAREAASKSYEQNLTRLIAAYRAALDRPTLPVVLGQINSTYGQYKPGPELVRNAIVRVAEADERVAVVRTSNRKPYTDYPKVDGTHYDAEGTKRLGVAMADALLRLSETEP